MRIQAKHFHSLQAELGEGPIWDPSRGVLWCVDIIAPAIHAIEPAGGRRRSWKAPQKVSWILVAADGHLVTGLADGIYQFESDRGHFRKLATVEAHLPANRLNDATVAADGTVWFGTMDDQEVSATGRFYRFNGEVHDCGLPSVCITNGPAISPDGVKLYTVDTLAREIWTHEIDADARLSGSRLFATISESDGWPDGVSCDDRGGLWLGLWGGWRARRYDAEGRVSAEVEFPVANITKVALGGPEGRTAYVTTARKGLDRLALAQQPLAGDLFTFSLDGL